MGGLYLREDYRFNTQPPEGGCIIGFNLFPYLLQFQHTAARRRLHIVDTRLPIKPRFNTQPPEGACYRRLIHLKQILLFQHTAARRRLLLVANQQARVTAGFNTQPPEGGCDALACLKLSLCRFNTEPPEGGYMLHKNIINS